MGLVERRAEPATLGESLRERRNGGLGRSLIGVLLSSFVPVLAVLDFEAHQAGVLILGLYVPMIVAQHRFLPVRWAGVAPALTIGASTWWGVWAAFPMPGTFAIRVLAPVVLVAVLLGLGTLDRWLQERTAYRYFVFTVPLFWSTLWFVMSTGPTGTIGQQAHALYRHPSLIQPASIVGGLGVTLIILLANWGLAALALSALGHEQFRAPRARRVAGAVGLVGLIWVGGSLLLMRAPEPTLRVAAVQPGLSGMVTSDALQRYGDLTRRAVARGARLVVWPEGALRFDPATTGTQRLLRLARETDAYIATGYWVSTPGVGRRNEAVIVTPEGGLLGPYAKRHPVTLIGERSETDYGYPVFDTTLGDIALLVCYDVDYLDSPRAVARQGADLIAVPSHDWSEIAEMHYKGFVLRAIENRVALVKADLAWDSAVIDPYGRLLERAVDADGREAVLTADVPMGSGTSPAAALGDGIGIGLAVATLAQLGLLGRVGNRPTPHEKSS